MWYIYILKCSDGALYTGITDNLERRFNEHKQGKGGHYTNYNRPFEILFTEIFQNRSQAEEREQQIKRWSKAKKLALIEGKLGDLQVLSKSRD